MDTVCDVIAPETRQARPDDIRRSQGGAFEVALLWFRPNGAALCRPRPTAWGQIFTMSIQPRRGGTKLHHNEKPNQPSQHRLGPPLGLRLFVVTGTQADGLG